MVAPPVRVAPRHSRTPIQSLIPDEVAHVVVRPVLHLHALVHIRRDAADFLRRRGCGLLLFGARDIYGCRWFHRGRAWRPSTSLERSGVTHVPSTEPGEIPLSPSVQYRSLPHH